VSPDEEVITHLR